ncbi:MotA/TolQ/ExbB proton channel family protein [Tepidiphilus margaritifer]|uniref:MotA/TolQ/ExbB proton channel family protein n=1 Tax=Tepidiphilus margaritifer TaxID=203471 RepID=UPI0003FF7712|nr:MotA/TolQ/ExbB proton channel family protein [Tepidiphilus margaritifer]
MNESMLHFFAQGDGVSRFIFLLLALLSVSSWAVILAKTALHLRLSRRAARFLRRFWNADDLAEIARELREHGALDPASHLVHHGLEVLERLERADENATTARTGPLGDRGEPQELLTRALRRAIDEARARDEAGMTLLGTTASSAPFIGLFGTVWGIYHALQAIAASGSASLDKVAGPIGEALVMTGFGLATAIPAAIAYNAFSRAQRRRTQELEAFAYDVYTFLVTGIKRPATRPEPAVVALDSDMSRPARKTAS